MRILTRLLLILTATFSLTGCMQHNGHIGDWFGTWKLESITIDGASDPSYPGNIFFQFQTNVVRIAEVDTSVSNAVKECFGSWSETDNTLTLNFGYTSDANKDNFTLPSILKPQLKQGENILSVSKESSRKMTWTLQEPDSPQTLTYTLKKQ